MIKVSDQRKLINFFIIVYIKNVGLMFSAAKIIINL